MEREKHFRKREAVLNCLRGTDVHPSAEWVYASLKPQIPDLSLGTVYRNLTYYKEKGEIISIGTVKGIERFDGNVNPHVHYICTECGCVMDLHSIAVPEELKSAAEKNSGGSVSACSLTFSGVCEKCKKVN